MTPGRHQEKRRILPGLPMPLQIQRQVQEQSPARSTLHVTFQSEFPFWSAQHQPSICEGLRGAFSFLPLGFCVGASHSALSLIQILPTLCSISQLPCCQTPFPFWLIWVSLCVLSALQSCNCAFSSLALPLIHKIFEQGTTFHSSQNPRAQHRPSITEWAFLMCLLNV